MRDIAARLTSALADRYRLERELGAGGMATVYLAEDLKHRRKVALKVLRPELAATMGAERFEREIEVAARLQHPHILGLLDSGDADGFFYYVMPYVEGETLRDRIGRTGELPVHEAVRLLAEVADALAVAHRAGVVHRDIKPENILLSGRHAMVMDFGVAKAVSEASGRQQLTTAGVALGTPAYMAPEQATADPQIDGRVDIYALGVLGYEMLCGHPPFHGLNPQQTLAAHVTQMPVPVGQRRPGIAAALDALIMRCLAKRPADRYQTADELVAALEPLATPSGGMTPTHTQPVQAVAAPPPWYRRTPVLAGGVAVLVLALGLVLRGRGPGPAISLVKTTRLTSAPGLEILPAISPDGKFVAYTARPSVGGGSRIYLQPIDGGRPIPVTDGMPGDQQAPDWSPDGSRLAFVLYTGDSASVMTMAPTGGSVRVMYPSKGGFPPDAPRWSPDGTLLAFEKGDSVLVCRPDGTGLRLVTRVNEAHSLTWSPDGRWLAGVRNNSEFVYSSVGFGNLAASTVFTVPSAGGTPRMVSDSTTLNISPVWLRHGRGLLYVSSGGGGRDIYQVPIGSDGRAEGPARRITTGLDAHTIALSRDGRRLAYTQYTRDLNIWMVKVPPGGQADTRDAVQITQGNQTIEIVRLSKDGKWLAYDSDLNGNADIFVVPAEGGTPRQVTDDPADDLAPAWSPDGTELAFHSFRHGNRDIYTVHTDGTGVTQVTSSPVNERFADWGTDTSLVYARDSAGAFALFEIFRASRSAPWGPPVWLANTPFPFTTAIDNGARFLYQGPSGVPATVPSGGGTPTPLPIAGTVFAVGRFGQLGSGVSMSRDGRTLYLSSAATGHQLQAMDIATGRRRTVVTFSAGDRQPARDLFETDGSRYYFVFGSHEADIWVADVEER